MKQGTWKQVVIAGAGASGAVMAKILYQRRSGISLTLLDRNSTTLRQLWPQRPERVRFRNVDLSEKGALRPFLAPGTLLVNAASLKLNHKMMKAALEAGCDYQDLSSALEDHTTVEQLQYHEAFQKAGLRGLICAGAAPGISSLMAAETAAELTTVDSLDIRFLEDQDATRLMFPWAPEVALEDCFIDSLVFQRGRFVKKPPLSGEEDFKFAGMRASVPVVRIYGEEVATLPKYLNCGRVEVKSGGSDIEAARELWRSLPQKSSWRRWVRDQGFRVPTPRALIATARKGEITNARLGIAVLAKGRSGRGQATVRMEAVFPDFKSIMRRMPGASYVGWPTGVSAALFAERLASVEMSGVFPAEALAPVHRKAVLKELKEYGVRLIRRKTAA